MKYCWEVIAISITVSLREQERILDKLSILSQSDDKQPAQNMLCTLYWELIAPLEEL